MRYTTMNNIPSSFLELRAVSVETLRRGGDDIFCTHLPLLVTRTSEKTYRSRASPRKPLPLPSLADGGSVDFSIVIYAYNETGRLPSMLEAILAHLNSPP
ncbi:hypothetical protein EDD16DRAFT_1630601 [Pisolithus croceorrhizus]|nr:hypothetical protein EDD16DRAFT_1630601 [Pisolithus croceorrhizus]KAI6142904.1 hypothetical protein EDD17DRAFT_1660822 [Pisolithus thermaeus]